MYKTSMFSLLLLLLLGSVARLQAQAYPQL
jgi:hypothetical protein